MKAVIFDIDGTIAKLDHRLHYILGNNKNYDMFYEECDKDTPISVVVSLLMDMHKLGNKIVLASGRTDAVKDKTVEWLKKNNIAYDALYMRKAGDHRSDVIVKSEILDMIIDDGYDVRFVVDDRSSVVKMWRNRGLTCLQCNEWEEGKDRNKNSATLTVMVGPSGAGKSTWLKNNSEKYGIRESHIISSDQIRHDMCGDFRDQSKNTQVFTALHDIVSTRLKNGLDTVVDATNIRNKDRVAVANLNKNGKVRYIIINRPMEEKYRDGEWRLDVGFDLIAKHEQVFVSNIKDILRGDNLVNVEVFDERT